MKAWQIVSRLIQLNVENPGQLKQLKVHPVLLQHMHCIEQTNSLCGLTSDFTHALLPAGWGSEGLLDDTQCIYTVPKCCKFTITICTPFHDLSHALPPCSSWHEMPIKAWKRKMTLTNQLATQHGWAWKQRQHMCSETHTNLGLKYCSEILFCSVQMQTDQSKNKKA